MAVNNEDQLIAAPPYEWEVLVLAKNYAVKPLKNPP